MPHTKVHSHTHVDRTPSLGSWSFPLLTVLYIVTTCLSVCHVPYSAAACNVQMNHLWWDPSFCISNKFPSDADTACPWATLKTALMWPQAPPRQEQELFALGWPALLSVPGSQWILSNLWQNWLKMMLSVPRAQAPPLQFAHTSKMCEVLWSQVTSPA